MLPDDCRWDQNPYTDADRFYVGRLAVGMVASRIDGRWIATVNRHLDDTARWRSAICLRPETGKRWVERWALARLERFRSEQPPVVWDAWAVGKD